MKRKLSCRILDNTANRPSLYEPPPQTSLKTKRTEIVHPVNSAATNNTTPKVSPSKDQRLFRESKLYSLIFKSLSIYFSF